MVREDRARIWQGTFVLFRGSFFPDTCPLADHITGAGYLLVADAIRHRQLWAPTWSSQRCTTLGRWIDMDRGSGRDVSAL